MVCFAAVVMVFMWSLHAGKGKCCASVDLVVFSCRIKRARVGSAPNLSTSSSICRTHHQFVELTIGFVLV
jgi:hypothetical protein